MTPGRYFHKPKGELVLVLAALGFLGAIGPLWREALVRMLAAGLFAMALDAPLLRWRKRHWVLPDAALLTGWLVAMVLARQTPLHVVLLTTAIAVISKHLLRTPTANVFNPAVLGLVATYYLYYPGHDWWGGLADRGWIGFVALGAGGVFITRKVHKLPLVLAFLGTYFLLFSAGSYFIDPMRLVAVFRGSDLNAVLFFAFFMLTDPPTSPPRPAGQVVYGVIAAVVSFAVFAGIGAAYFVLAGLLPANLLEAGRRLVAYRRRHRPDSPRMGAT